MGIEALQTALEWSFLFIGLVVLWTVSLLVGFWFFDTTITTLQKILEDKDKPHE